MDRSIKDIIRLRRSVRTYNAEAVRSEDMKKLEDFISALDDPFGVPVEYRFLNAKEHGLSSPVIVGEKMYLGAKAKKGPFCEIAVGYGLERVMLYALSLGIGSVWIAGTMDRPGFEKAMDVKNDELMPAVTPIGYIAEKMSVRETVMRKGVKADERLDFGELFFEGGLTKPLGKGGRFDSALEAVRLAPSAVNKQPWRVAVCGNAVHFYEKHSKGMAARAFDVQLVDMGIALAHFVLAAKEDGINGRLVATDPKIVTRDDTDYIMTFVADE